MTKRKKKPIEWPALPDDAEILAVDPSLHSSGWVRLRVDSSVVDCGCVKVPAKYTGVECVAELARRVESWWGETEPSVSPWLLVIEEQYTPSKGRMSGPLRTAQASGAWLGSLLSYEKNLPVIEAYPATWQAHHGIKGLRTKRKEAMTRIAKERFPWCTWGEDSADALGIGLYAAHHIRAAR